MFPIVDLNEVTTNCEITVAVGEATNSLTTGVLTVTIKNGGAAGHTTITKNVVNLGQTLQVIQITPTPHTGKIHHVVAVLLLASGETSSDDEFIQLC
jgi:hypothetical protein